MNILIIISVLLPLALSASCPEPPLVKEFDPEKMIGQWHVVYRTKEIVTEKCPMISFRKGEDGKIDVVKKQKNNLSDALQIVVGEGTHDKEKPGKIKIVFDEALRKRVIDFNVLDLDDDYALCWECHKKVLLPVQNVYVLSRTRKLKDTTISRFHNHLKKLNLSLKKLLPTHQTECEDMDN